MRVTVRYQQTWRSEVGMSALKKQASWERCVLSFEGGTCPELAEVWEFEEL